MPVLTAKFSAEDPVIECGIAVSGPRQSAMNAAGISVPAPQIIRGLIDTGASCTCVDPSIITKLGLLPTGVCSIISASSGSTPHQCNQYDIGFVLFTDARKAHIVSLTIPVVEASLEHQGFHALIGRDVLDQGVMIYNGKAQEISLFF